MTRMDKDTRTEGGSGRGNHWAPTTHLGKSDIWGKAMPSFLLKRVRIGVCSFQFGPQSKTQEMVFLICKLNMSPECRTPSPFMEGHLNSHFKMVCLNNVRIRAQMSAFTTEGPLGKRGWRDLLASHSPQRTVCSSCP